MPLDGTTYNPTLEILQAAKTYIIERGWCQGSALNRAGNVCIVGAVNMSLDWQDDTDLYCNVLWHLEETLGLPEHLSRELANWNDVKGRTVDEVLNLFDTTIARVRQEELVNA